MDALGALSAVPQIGISMVKPGWDAVTVKAFAPAATASVGVRPPEKRNGAAFCSAVVDR